MKYHVTEKWDGKELQSAANRMGEEAAITMFMEKWETDDASFAADQVHYIYLYDTLEDAQNHQETYGGEILIIDDRYLELDIDPIEGYAVTFYDIPSELIEKVSEA